MLSACAFTALPNGELRKKRSWALLGLEIANQESARKHLKITIPLLEHRVTKHLEYARFLQEKANLRRCFLVTKAKLEDAGEPWEAFKAEVGERIRDPQDFFGMSYRRFRKYNNDWHEFMEELG